MGLSMNQSVHSIIHSAKCTACGSTNVQLWANPSRVIVELWHPVAVTGKQYKSEMRLAGDAVVGNDVSHITGYQCKNCPNAELLADNETVLKAPWYLLVGRLYEDELGIRLKNKSVISGSDHGLKCDQAGLSFISGPDSLSTVWGSGNITNDILWK